MQTLAAAVQRLALHVGTASLHGESSVRFEGCMPGEGNKLTNMQVVLNYGLCTQV